MAPFSTRSSAAACFKYRKHARYYSKICKDTQLQVTLLVYNRFWFFATNLNRNICTDLLLTSSLKTNANVHWPLRHLEDYASCWSGSQLKNFLSIRSSFIDFSPSPSRPSQRSPGEVRAPGFRGFPSLRRQDEGKLHTQAQTQRLHLILTVDLFHPGAASDRHMQIKVPQDHERRSGYRNSK